MQQRYFVELSYDGTRYHGWQRQPNGLTVQEVLERDLSLIARENIKLTGAGRTDTGVHALVYYAHFDLETIYTSDFLNQLVFRINSLLPDDIAIHRIFLVDKDLHARFSAVSRTYRYCLATTRNPFRKAFTHYHFGPLDIALMNQGAGILKEYVDFTSFSKVDTDARTNNCLITNANWDWEGNELVFTITADRFLRNMVRAIVGTLLLLGTGKITLNHFVRIIESKNRSEAGQSAPACGLILASVKYPDGCIPEKPDDL